MVVDKVTMDTKSNSESKDPTGQLSAAIATIRASVRECITTPHNPRSCTGSYSSSVSRFVGNRLYPAPGSPAIGSYIESG
jgi:phage baseplate assembly protein W